MKIKAYIHAQWNKYTKKFDYSVLQCDMTEYGYVLLEVKELTVKLPSDDSLRNAAITVLRAKKNRILAEASVQAQELDDEAQELLCLPFTIEQ